MEEMARTMGHYANNLEQLKREKAMLTVTYEVTDLLWFRRSAELYKLLLSINLCM